MAKTAYSAPRDSTVRPVEPKPKKTIGKIWQALKDVAPVIFQLFKSRKNGRNPGQ